MAVVWESQPLARGTPSPFPSWIPHVHTCKCPSLQAQAQFTYQHPPPLYRPGKVPLGRWGREFWVSGIRSMVKLDGRTWAQDGHISLALPIFHPKRRSKARARSPPKGWSEPRPFLPGSRVVLVERGTGENRKAY